MSGTDGWAHAAMGADGGGDGGGTYTDWPTDYTFPGPPWPPGWAYTYGSEVGAVGKAISTTTTGATKSAALDAAWTALLADEAEESGASVVSIGFYAAYHYTTNYRITLIEDSRSFYSLTVPATTTNLILYGATITQNYYMDGSSTNLTNPSWTLQVYIGTTDPGTLDNDDWAYGTLAGTATITSMGVGDTIDPIELSNFTAGTTNYLQFRVAATKPTHINDVTWDTSTIRKEVEEANINFAVYRP